VVGTPYPGVEVHGSAESHWARDRKGSKGPFTPGHKTCWELTQKMVPGVDICSLLVTVNQNMMKPETDLITTHMMINQRRRVKKLEYY
jgi:hypothetical protein